VKAIKVMFATLNRHMLPPFGRKLANAALWGRFIIRPSAEASE